MYLEHISGPADVKKLSLAEMTALCGEIRTALIEKAQPPRRPLRPELRLRRGDRRAALRFRLPEG